MAITRTVFIDTAYSNYADLASHYDAQSVHVILLDDTTPHGTQIQDWLAGHADEAESINVVTPSSGVTGLFTPRVAFIDPGVSGIEIIIAGMPPNVTVVLLDAERDGVAQIHDFLAANTGQVGAIDIITDLAGVDVVSHGAPGEVQLGSTVLNAATLATYGAQLAAIGSHLGAGADLLLYGCDVASGSVGQQFIAALASATGVDVAASTNLTGGSAAGGDWTLEASTGEIETEALNIAAYDRVLDTASGITDFTLSADTGRSSTDAVTNTASQTITGHFTASTQNAATPTIYVSTDGTGNTRTLANVDYTADSGSGSFSVNVTLAAGTGKTIQFWSGVNGNNKIAERAYTLDTSAPATTVATVRFSSDAGVPGDFITNTPAQTITGTLSAPTAAGDVVRISLDNGATWQTATNVIGQNAFSLSGIVLAGSNTMQLKVEDLAGNAGPVRSQAYVLDTAAVAGTLAFGNLNDSGITGDGITNDTAFNLTLAGNEAGSNVVYEVSRNGGAFSVTSAAQSGLADGSYLFRARVADIAGNTAPTNTLSVTIDATPPAAPGITGFSDSSGSGADTLTSDRRPTLTINAEADTRVEVYLGNVMVGTAAQTAAGSGVYTFTSAELADGSYSFTARSIDRAGNSSAASAPQALTVDTSLSAPTLMLATNSGAGDDLLTNDASLVFNAPDNDAVRVITVNGNTVDAYNPAILEDGAHTVTVTDTDAAGNTKTASLSFTLDRSLTAPTVALAADSGAPGDGLTNDASLVFNEPDNDAVRVIKVNGDTVNAYNPATLQEGANIVTVTDTDAAGNTKTASLSFTLDRSLTAPTVALAADSGASDDGLTNDASLVFNEPDNDAVRVIKVNGNTVNGYNPATLDDGAHTVTVTDTDAAGNTKTTSLSFTLDRSLSAPTVALAADSGAPGDGLTNDANLVFNTPDNDAVRVIKVNGNAVNAYNPSMLEDGSHTVTVTDTDAAGNTKTASLSFTLDRSLTAPTLSLAADSGASGDGLTNDARLVFNEPDNDAVRVIKVNGNTVDHYDASALQDGAHTVTVTDTDTAGNTRTTLLSFTLDTTLNAPTLALTTNSGAPNDMLTNDARLTFNGPDMDATRVITVNGTQVGNYDAAALADGDYTVMVTDTDGAHNSKSESISFTLDRSGPLFSSGASASVAENTGANQLVYQAQATDAHAFTFSLEGADAGRFDISATGAVTLKDNPDFEAKNTYQFGVRATDAAGNRTIQTVSLGVTNVNEGPTANVVPLCTVENAPISFQASNVVTDPDAGDTHTLTLNTSSAVLSWDEGSTSTQLINPVTRAVVNLSSLTVKATVSADGSTVTLTPPAELDWMVTGQKMKATFVYTATDAGGMSSTNSVTLTVTGSTNDKGKNLNGGNGNDTLSGDTNTNAEDVLQGGNGNDTLSGHGGSDALYGGNGDDMLSGGAGIDYLYGDSGDDRLDGGTDGDFLFGGKGNDIVTGGAGADKFVFEAQSGNDRITDFKLAEGDKLFFTNMLATMNANDFIAKYVTDTGNDLLISMPGGSVVLVGVQSVDGLAAALVFGPM
ncbi:Ig-like domain-containing protein [Massilia oculi]|uniref:Ig-like domain-containing protein n=1 Tax=Massilia hydrophila TaxID=3044279 RepID=A0ABS7Y4T5_9BURK|nr:Ig-like domain-containing protein [Massilia oculi]MCA1854353.1 Ig-like domain-containing protein [Massilia oculi]